MELLKELFMQPITQLIALGSLIGALQKGLGIDVVALLRWFFSVKNQTAEINADNRNALQPLYSKIDELAQYANHETTEHTGLLREIRDSLRDNFASIHAKHDEWDRRGIPTEDCKK